jgi:hypothetical protein
MEAVCVMMDVKPTMVADPNLAGKRVYEVVCSYTWVTY